MSVVTDTKEFFKTAAHITFDVARALVTILLDQRAAERYCNAVSVPPLSGPVSDEWSNTIDTLRQDLEAADNPAKYAAMTDKAVTLINGIAGALQSSSAPSLPTSESVAFKLVVPILLHITQRSHKVAYVALLVLVMIDQRVQDSLPGGTFGDRMLQLLAGLAEKAGWSGRQADGDAEADWAAITADAIVLSAALLQAVTKNGTPTIWYGLDLSNPDDPQLEFAHDLLRRAATLSFAFDRPVFDFEKYTGRPAGQKIGPQFLLPTPTFTITTMPVPAAGTAPQKLLVQLGAQLAEQTKNFGGGWQFRYSNDGAVLLLISREGLDTGGSARFKAELFQEGDIAGRPSQTVIDPGQPPTAGISLKTKRIGVGVQVDQDGPAAWLQIDQCEVTIAGGHWLADHIPKLSFSFDAAAEVSLAGGLRWRGGVGGDVVFTIGKTVPLGVGKLRINAARLQIAAKGTDDQSVDAEGALQLAVTTDLTLSLFGLLDIKVIGLGAALSIGSDRLIQGNIAGVAKIGLLPLVPSSAGLAISRNGLKGAGILTFDASKGMLFGGVELDYKGKFSFKGLGLYQQARDGNPSNWLIALSMTTAASPGGFVPKGGGLLYASDRRTEPEAFLAAVNTGDFQSILAPTDIVGNAIAYQAALDRLFPVNRDSQVFGLLVKFEAFNGKLHLDVGALLEWAKGDIQRAYIIAAFSFIPLRRDAPDPDDRPVQVLADGVAIFDFAKGEINVRIALRNSRIWGGELTGEAMIFYGAPQTPGSSRAFYMSVGGFHPSYVPESGLFVPRRLMVTVSKGDHLKLEMSAYLALTPQSFQLGFRSSIEAHLYGFGIRGRLDIDALIHFDFRIVIGIKISVELLLGSKTLAAVSFEGSLSIFKPTILAGAVKIKFLFWTLSKSGSLPIIGGSPEQVSVNVSALLEAAIKERANWDFGSISGFVPTSRDRPGAWYDGAARPSFRQNVVPFDVEVDRCAAASFDAPRTFHIEEVRTETAEIKTAPATEEFPIGQYLDLNDEQMLGGAMFEHWNAGFGMDLPFDQTEVTTVSLDCEQLVRDPEAPVEKPLFDFQAIASQLSIFAVVKDEPQPIGLKDMTYHVLDSDLAPHSAGLNLAQARAAVRTGDRIFAEISA